MCKEREVEDRENGRRSPVGRAADGREGREGELGGESPSTRQTGLRPAQPDSTTGLTGEGGDTTGSAGERRGGKKWPLEGFWGGIKGRLRPNDPRNGRQTGDKEDEGSDSEEADEEDDVKGGAGGGEDVRNGVHHSGDREETTARLETASDTVHHALNTVRSLESDDSGASTQRVREARSDRPHHVSGRETEEAEGTKKPAPNPKPTKLTSAQGSECSSGSEGVKFSSLSESMKLDSAELGETESPRTQPKIRQQRTTKSPQTPTKLEHQRLNTAKGEVGATTPQRRKRRAELGAQQDIGSGAGTAKPVLPAFSDSQPSPSSHHKPPKPAKPANLEKQANDTDTEALLARLLEKAEENDYYRLFRVESSASTDDLARVRREMARKLHPDHFTGQPEKQERSESILNPFHTMALFSLPIFGL